MNRRGAKDAEGIGGYAADVVPGFKRDPSMYADRFLPPYQPKILGGLGGLGALGGFLPLVPRVYRERP